MAQAYNPLRETIRDNQKALKFRTRKAYKKYHKKYEHNDSPAKHEIHELFYKDNPDARTNYWKKIFAEPNEN